ncbi:MAG TPA: glucose-6-phosphate isomerase [Alphaproteobacteria bacterium]
MLFEHDLSRCFADSIGESGIDRSAFEPVLAQTADSLAELREVRQKAGLPLLELPAARDDLIQPAAVAERLRRSSDQVILLGTGGSSLGGQTLAALAESPFGPRPGRPKLHFLDNIDPVTFEALLAQLDLSRTGFLVVSKSGGTAETLMQFLTLYPEVERRLGRSRAAERFAVITEPHANPLRRIAQRQGIEILDHDPGVGGRYSALSLVGLLPAMIAGLDPVAIRQGASDVLQRALTEDPAESQPAMGAAMNVALLWQKRLCTTVLMPYIDALASFGLWFRQLWAESLGKDGTGSTPIRAMGTVDQHSQLQLYLAGPQDKFYTLIMAPQSGKGSRVAPSLAEDPALSYLAGRSMGDLLEAEQRATLETLASNGRPVRAINLPRLDERAMGALMMHFMLETIIAADLLGVNPFDQPAVEEGKRLAREHLAEMAGEG